MSAKHYVYDWSIEVFQLADKLKAVGYLLGHSMLEDTAVGSDVCSGLGSLMVDLAAELEFIQKLMPLAPNDYYYHRAANLMELLERSDTACGNERR